MYRKKKERKVRTEEEKVEENGATILPGKSGKQFEFFLEKTDKREKNGNAGKI